MGRDVLRSAYCVMNQGPHYAIRNTQYDYDRSITKCPACDTTSTANPIPPTLWLSGSDHSIDITKPAARNRIDATTEPTSAVGTRLAQGRTVAAGRKSITS